MHSRRDQVSLTLFYEDDGVGISPEDRENLFKEGRGKGTGYGLYLIRRIMEFYRWKFQEEGEYSARVIQIRFAGIAYFCFVL